MKELLLSNIVMLGEVPSNAVTWQNDDQVDEINYSVRASYFADRLSSIGVDECTTDPLGNPIAIIKGTDPKRPPILVSAELDSLCSPNRDIHYAVNGKEIIGVGILDNAIGAASVMSLPDILHKTGITFKSDIILAGIAHTMSSGNGIVLVKNFLEKLERLPRSAIIVKGSELGRLNYFSEAVIRADITIERLPSEKSSQQNMIVVANELIDRLLELELPQKPMTNINIGMIRGGYKYGTPASTVHVGIEISSTSNSKLVALVQKIRSLIKLIKYEKRVNIEYKAISSLGAESIGWTNPITQAALDVFGALNLEPDVYPSVSELFYFLRRGIPAITIGIANGDDEHQETAKANIKSIYKGMAQLVGILMMIDEEASYV